MMNKAYIVKREHYLASIEETIDFTVGVYQTQEDADKAIKIYQEYLESNFPEIQYCYSYEIKEIFMNNFDPKFM